MSCGFPFCSFSWFLVNNNVRIKKLFRSSHESPRFPLSSRAAATSVIYPVGAPHVGIIASASFLLPPFQFTCPFSRKFFVSNYLSTSTFNAKSYFLSQFSSTYLLFIFPRSISHHILCSFNAINLWTTTFLKLCDFLKVDI